VAGAAFRSAAVLAATVIAGWTTACGGGPEVPAPRPLILHSGARLAPSQDRLQQIDAWVRPELDNIQQDPSFLIVTQGRDSLVYPWEGLEIEGDTASIALQTGVPEAQAPYMIYAHLHLMKTLGKLDQWLPQLADSTGYGLELAILRRTADAWLYARSAWDAPPYEALDQLTYAREDGYLEPMILMARPDDFPDARRAWVANHPDGLDTYRRWFRETFGKEPPGQERAAKRGGPRPDSPSSGGGGGSAGARTGS